MDGEVTAALIGGVSGTAGVLLGSTAAMWSARHQGRLAVQGALETARKTYQGALETARSTYRGPIDTARRSAQRDVFAAFLTTAQEWTRAAEVGTVAATRWDTTVRLVLAACRDEGRPYRGVDQELEQRFRTAIDSCSTVHRVTEAVQHVLLEAATTDVASAAQNVEHHAIQLVRLLRRAGETRLEDTSVSRDDPTNHVPPNPARSQRQLDALREAIQAFTLAAAAHLNSHDISNAPVS
ncbi:hypothetical protein ACWGJ0_39475 [Streptomyces massasporeus]